MVMAIRAGEHVVFVVLDGVSRFFLLFFVAVRTCPVRACPVRACPGVLCVPTFPSVHFFQPFCPTAVLYKVVCTRPIGTAPYLSIGSPAHHPFPIVFSSLSLSLSLHLCRTSTPPHPPHASPVPLCAYCCPQEASHGDLVTCRNGACSLSRRKERLPSQRSITGEPPSVFSLGLVWNNWGPGLVADLLGMLSPVVDLDVVFSRGQHAVAAGAGKVSAGKVGFPGPRGGGGDTNVHARSFTRR